MPSLTLNARILALKPSPAQQQLWQPPPPQQPPPPPPPPSAGPLAAGQPLPPPAAKCDWSEHNSPEGYKYYYNTVTRESKWEMPPELAAFELSQQGQLLPGAPPPATSLQQQQQQQQFAMQQYVVQTAPQLPSMVLYGQQPGPPPGGQQPPGQHPLGQVAGSAAPGAASWTWG